MFVTKKEENKVIFYQETITRFEKLPIGSIFSPSFNNGVLFSGVYMKIKDDSVFNCVNLSNGTLFYIGNPSIFCSYYGELNVENEKVLNMNISDINTEE